LKNNFLKIGETETLFNWKLFIKNKDDMKFKTPKS